MKKIIISSNTSWYLFNFRRNTIFALLNQGFEVHAVSPKDEYSTQLAELGCIYHHIQIDQGGINPLNDLITLAQFVRLYRSIRPDVALHFTPKNNIYGNIAARLSGSRAINNIAGLGMVFINETLLTKLVRQLYRFSLSTADCVFFQNQEDLESFINQKIVREAQTARLPGSGVDLSRFRPRPKFSGKPLKFLLVSRMLYEKGIEHYVEAAKLIKDQYGEAVEFRLLGFLDTNNPGAVSKDQMVKWVDSGVVVYRGTTDRVEDEIAEIDCVVLPSFYREGVPKTLLEAAAMGKPIITTDHTGCRDTVDHGVNGYLCEIKSTSSLAEQINRFVELTPEQRTSMGKSSREKVVREFDEKIVIGRYMEKIDEFLTSVVF